MKHRAFDMIGNIAIVNFKKGVKAKEKKDFANKLMNQNNSIRTVLQKVGKIKGRLRKISTTYVAGERTKEVLYKENNCVFRFNIDTTYFSPRLSNERKEISSNVKKGENVLVMFAGVAPFSIVIAKNSNVKKVVSVEINREANKYAKLNVERNNLKNRVEIVQGDVKKLGSLLAHNIDGKVNRKTSLKVNRVNNLKKSRAQRGKLPKFDVIVMPRPRLKETFLKEALKFSKKGTRIYYYDFCPENEINFVVEKIKQQVKQSRKKIKILKIKKAGEIAPYKIRVRVDFKIL